MRDRNEKPQGVTLLELMVAMTLLFVCFAGVFILFRQGTSTLRTLEQKGGIQADFLALKVGLRADFQRTDLGSVTIGHAFEERDSVSCLVLGDWSESSSFSTGQGGPIWDRRVVYLFEASEPSSLNRIVVEPEPEFLRPRPLDDIKDVLESGIVTKTRVSDEVRRFQASVDISTQQVRFDITLSEGEKAGVSGRFVFVPRNTETRL